MRKLTLVLGLLALLAVPALAEPRHLLATSGNWSLYQDESYVIDWRKGNKLILSNACVAETVQVQTTMQVIALPPSTPQQDLDLNGQLLMRVAVNQWNYSPDWNQLIVTVMNRDSKRKAFFNGPWITALMGPWATQGNPFGRAAAIWGEEIVFKDRARQELTAVRASGLNAIYPQLLACGSR